MRRIAEDRMKRIDEDRGTASRATQLHRLERLHDAGCTTVAEFARLRGSLYDDNDIGATVARLDELEAARP